MRFVESDKEILENCLYLRYLLSRTNDERYEYAAKKIQSGRCFLVLNNEDYEFYPSRFIGYYRNSPKKHERNDERDGRPTTKIITEILGIKLILPGDPLHSFYESEYHKYCERNYIPVQKFKRKYWPYQQPN
jgi:hypothetical protein